MANQREKQRSDLHRLRKIPPMSPIEKIKQNLHGSSEYLNKEVSSISHIMSAGSADGSGLHTEQMHSGLIIIFGVVLVIGAFNWFCRRRYYQFRKSYSSASRLDTSVKYV